MHTPIDGYVHKKYPKGSVTQWFGENPELYGHPRFKNRMDGHNGIDIVAPWRTPLLAVCSGEIIDVNRSEEGYGRHVRILDNEGVDGYFNQWVYGHCEDIFVEVGDRVEAGQTIATMGNTGFVISGATPFWKHNPYAGTHLHLGVRKVQLDQNGYKYPNSSVGFRVKDHDNGYFGYIDFSDELVEATSEKEVRVQMLTIISILNYLKKLYGG